MGIKENCFCQIEKLGNRATVKKCLEILVSNYGKRLARMKNQTIEEKVLELFSMNRVLTSRATGIAKKLVLEFKDSLKPEIDLVNSDIQGEFLLSVNGHIYTKVIEENTYFSKLIVKGQNNLTFFDRESLIEHYQSFLMPA